MAVERKWVEIPPQTLSSDGTSAGLITVPDSSIFKVKQEIRLKSSTVTAPLLLQVKRVASPTTLYVGLPTLPINKYEDVSAFKVADNAVIWADEQSRPSIVPDAFERAVFEEEPTVAIRTFQVDALGNRYTKSNPLPVQLSDGSLNIGTVNAELEVQLTDKESSLGANDYDITRVGDGQNELNINPDGSLNVVVQTSTGEEVISQFNEVSSVANGVETEILSYTVPSGIVTTLNKIDFSGQNIATYSIEINGDVEDKKRTYFGSSLDGTFNFANGTKGLRLNPGDIVKLKVLHVRPFLADFSARIQLVQA